MNNKGNKWKGKYMFIEKKVIKCSFYLMELKYSEELIWNVNTYKIKQGLVSFLV